MAAILKVTILDHWQVYPKMGLLILWLLGCHFCFWNKRVSRDFWLTLLNNWPVFGELYINGGDMLMDSLPRLFVVDLHHFEAVLKTFDMQAFSESLVHEKKT